MALHLHPVVELHKDPDVRASMERTVRFVRHHVTNLVASIERQGLVSENTAWELTMEGFLEAIAERLSADEDPDKATIALTFRLRQLVGDRLAAQDAEFGKLEAALAGAAP